MSVTNRGCVLGSPAASVVLSRNNWRGGWKPCFLGSQTVYNKRVEKAVLRRAYMTRCTLRHVADALSPPSCILPRTQEPDFGARKAHGHGGVRAQFGCMGEPKTASFRAKVPGSPISLKPKRCASLRNRGLRPPMAPRSPTSSRPPSLKMCSR